jgi:hypothetical protein
LSKPIPKVYTTRFFQLITTRQFTEAERILERVKQKMHVSERNRGYFQALFGMLLTQRNNDDRYAFLSGIDLSNKKQLKQLRQEFQGHVESRLHAEYDRGFFEAWVDYMKILPKFEAPISPVVSKGVEETEKETETETEAEANKETNDQIASEEEKAELEKQEPAEEHAEVELVKTGQSTLVDFPKQFSDNRNIHA